MTERNRDRELDAERQTHEAVQKRAQRYFQTVYRSIME